MKEDNIRYNSENSEKPHKSNTLFFFFFFFDNNKSNTLSSETLLKSAQIGERRKYEKKLLRNKLKTQQNLNHIENLFNYFTYKINPIIINYQNRNHIL